MCTDFTADESLKDKMRLLLLWVGSLVTLHSFVLTHKTPLLKQLHIFLATHRVSKSHLKAGFSFHRYVHFSCVLLYILGFHHKPGASDQKDFTHVKFTTQLFSVQQRWWVLKGRNTSATVYIYIKLICLLFFTKFLLHQMTAFKKLWKMFFI